MAEIKRYAFFMDVGNTRRLGVPIHVGLHTSWFRIMDGARSSYVIKRHHIKHNVQIKETTREPFHTTIRYEAQTS